MMLISHRGNLNGKFESYENEPMYIDKAIDEGFDVEVDVWYIDDKLFLGHDNPQYGVDFRWFRDRLSKLWIHCKNIQSLQYFKECVYDVNYFWHQEDDVTITSIGYFWTYPGKKLTTYSIAVLPESVKDWELTKCLGICSDYIKKYKK